MPISNNARAMDCSISSVLCCYSPANYFNKLNACFADCLPGWPMIGVTFLPNVKRGYLLRCCCLPLLLLLLLTVYSFGDDDDDLQKHTTLSASSHTKCMHTTTTANGQTNKRTDVRENNKQFCFKISIVLFCYACLIRLKTHQKFLVEMIDKTKTSRLPPLSR